MKTVSISTASPPFAVTYVVVLSLLAACRAGASLRLVPNIRELRVDIGDTARLECYLITDREVTVYGSFTWTDKDGNILSDTEDGRISVSHNELETVSTLTIDDVQRADEGGYTCSYANLPSVSILLDIVVEPHFKNVSLYQEFVVGTDAVVECPAFLGEPRGEMYWFDNQEIYIAEGNSQFTPEDTQLIIQHIRMENAGTYCCRLYLHGVIDRRCIEVVVQERSVLAPQIAHLPPNPIQVMYGDPLNLTCQLEEPQENVVYSWSINTEYEHNHITNASATLVREPKKFLSGGYTCTARNSHGYDTRVFFVTVQAPPRPEECSMGSQSGDEGTNIVLRYCEITSPVQLGGLTFQWSKDGEIIEIGNNSQSKYELNHQGYLTINDAQVSDSGQYLVRILNLWGSAEHTIQLEVTRLPNAMIEFTFELVDNEAGYSCEDVQEMKELVSVSLSQQLCGSHCSGVNLTNSMISCSDQTRGEFTAVLVGSRAVNLAAEARSRKDFQLDLTDELSIAMTICEGNCGASGTQQQSSKSGQVAGGAVAAVIIIVAVVTLGLVVTAILVYRRRKHTAQVTDSTDPENAVPSTSPPVAMETSTIMENTTVLNQSNGGNVVQPPTPFALTQQCRPTHLHLHKPVYGRSLSLDLPRKQQLMSP